MIMEQGVAAPTASITAGDYILSDRLGLVEVVRVHPFGTFDVRDPTTDCYYRVSGLPVTHVAGRLQPYPGCSREPALHAVVTPSVMQ
jgi:hypothetical protein